MRFSIAYFSVNIKVLGPWRSSLWSSSLLFFLREMGRIFVVKAVSVIDKNAVKVLTF